MNKIRMIALVVMVALMGFGTYAFAGKGMKSAAGQGGGCAAMQNLSAEDQAKVKAEMDAFFKDTETLRTQIQQKALELKTEMQKTEVDAQKAAAIQTEISALHAQMDQKRLQHHINLSKINPALGSCFKGFMGGPGHHGGMKPPCADNQNCTNCPYANQTSSQSSSL